LGKGDRLGWTAEMHTQQGNVVLGDGSVQQLTSSQLTAALKASSPRTNRFLVP
jgi:hypothetical protein